MNLPLFNRSAKICAQSYICGRFLHLVYVTTLNQSVCGSGNTPPLLSRARSTPHIRLSSFTTSLRMADLPTVPVSSYLGQEAAQRLDEELFTKYEFSVDQLMEIAGLSCAVAIHEVYPPKNGGSNRVLILCGPGNNGGDGLVCARHLSLFGYYPVDVYYPKRTPKHLYNRLVTQCENFDIKFIQDLPHAQQARDTYCLIVDGLFGFSFKPPVRELFLPAMSLLTSDNRPPVCSIDVPSGWPIEGAPNDSCIKPEMLISLTAPKQCAAHFKGTYHYIGGRFVPQALKDKYKLNLPEYPGSSCCQRIAS